MKDREQIAQALAASGYIADGELSTAISLMQLLKRPLLLEGEAGVGKTEVAKALAAVHDTELIRLQCYEGLRPHSARRCAPCQESPRPHPEEHRAAIRLEG